ncbi:uncharacterized protein LOC141903096 [Tubulanus polymorphus]|uniref:uncharacterized protein LOC141903096 n=1 Tax=Tubulanus polymorphus TaxID=672921 RepID=UPI003DA23A58
MMTASGTNRKRGRAVDDEIDECIPISKRINRLQIGAVDQNMDVSNHSQYSQSSMTAQSSDVNLQQQQQQYPNYAKPENYLSPWQQMTNNNYLPSPSATENKNYNVKTSDEIYSDFRDVPPGGELVNDEEEGMVYEPELGVEDNPHYYDINNVLFHAHIHRTQRLKIQSKHSS